MQDIRKNKRKYKKKDALYFIFLRIKIGEMILVHRSNMKAHI